MSVKPPADEAEFERLVGKLADKMLRDFGPFDPNKTVEQNVNETMEKMFTIAEQRLRAEIFIKENVGRIVQEVIEEEKRLEDKG
jgi:nitrogen-specific signal transduction histidine kinase